MPRGSLLRACHLCYSIPFCLLRSYQAADQVLHSSAAHRAGGSGAGAPTSGDVHRALSSSADLAAALDDVRSGSSVAALQDELAEKNRLIEQLQVGAWVGIRRLSGQCRLMQMLESCVCMTLYGDPALEVVAAVALIWLL